MNENNRITQNPQENDKLQQINDVWSWSFVNVELYLFHNDSLCVS